MVTMFCFHRILWGQHIVWMKMPFSISILIHSSTLCAVAHSAHICMVYISLYFHQIFKALRLCEHTLEHRLYVARFSFSPRFIFHRVTFSPFDFVYLTLFLANSLPRPMHVLRHRFATVCVCARLCVSVFVWVAFVWEKRVFHAIFS